MLTTQEFEDWCRRLNLSEEARTIIHRIRTSPPAHRVRSGARNVSGRYASHKMGRTIQYRTRTLAKPAILLMEHDPTVLEFYDQPNLPIKLAYLDRTGLPTACLCVPDFFVLRDTAAGWEEWKDEQQLVNLTQKMPHRYQRQEDGRWLCPPGEQHATGVGLYYRLHSSTELNEVLVRNLEFLADYLHNDCPAVESSAAKAICDRVSAESGITLQELLADRRVSSDDLYALIATGDLYVNMETDPLPSPEQVRVFLNAGIAQVYGLSITSQTRAYLAPTFTLTVGEQLSWDGTLWTIANVGEHEISLLHEKKTRVQRFPIAIFEEMIKQGVVKGIPMDPPTGPSEEAHTRLKRASPADLNLAARRYRIIEPLLHRKPPLPDDPTPGRTRRHWLKRFRQAEACYGNGFLGLLPQRSSQGNRCDRLSEVTLALMEQQIVTHYETLKQPSKMDSYRRLVMECQRKQTDFPTYKTFCKKIAARPRHEQTVKRQGPRAAYADGPRHHRLSVNTPRHGDRPFEIGHIDHTELDIELVDSTDGKNLGRPWATFFQDAYSRRFLAVYITFDPPSYVSAAMVLRICVSRFSRLPHIIMVDGGKEFGSTDFETLLAYCRCTKQTRPPAQARFGSVLERLFGTTNTQFIHNLRGNTQLMKNVRQVVKSVNPKHLACWTMGTLYEHLCEWAYEVYDTTPHPALGQTPRDAFEQGLAKTGQREHRRIPCDDTFRILTLPSPRKGRAKVLPGEGVTINYLRYWSDEFRAPGVENSSVDVRYDPFDCSVAYAYVNNHWVLCKTGNFSKYQHRSTRELLLITEEQRKNSQLAHRQYGQSNARLAEWLSKVEQTETILQQQRRDAEQQQVFRFIAGEPPLSSPPTQGPSALPAPPASTDASPPQASIDGNNFDDEDLTFEVD